MCAVPAHAYELRKARPGVGLLLRAWLLGELAQPRQRRRTCLLNDMVAGCGSARQKGLLKEAEAG